MYINETNLKQKNRTVRKFINENGTPSHWSEQLSHSLDALERSIRASG
jgi:hypothetical protein